MKAAIPDLKKAFEDKACECAGCCAPADPDKVLGVCVKEGGGGGNGECAGCCAPADPDKVLGVCVR